MASPLLGGRQTVSNPILAQGNEVYFKMSCLCVAPCMMTYYGKRTGCGENIHSAEQDPLHGRPVKS